MTGGEPRLAVQPLDPATTPLAGTTLIEASAGTGKTHSIASLYLRLLLEADLPVDRVLVVTFTRAATAELRRRLRERVREALDLLERPWTQGKKGSVGAASSPDSFLVELLAARSAERERDRARLLAALHSFDEAAVFTIHGFCQRVLRDHAFEGGLPFESRLLAHPEVVLEEVTRDLWIREMQGQPPLLLEALEGLGVTWEALFKLTRTFQPHAELRTLPESTNDGAAFGRAFASWDEARRAAGAVWQKEREAILHLLEQAVDGKRLNGRSYPRKTLRSEWGPALDVALAADAGLSDRFKKLGLLSPQGWKTNQGQTPPKHPFFDACAKVVEAEAGLEPLGLSLLAGLFAASREELKRRKEESHTQSFDDVLRELAEALRSPAGTALTEKIRRRFPVVLIDEFQDTDPLQYEIFQRLSGASESTEDSPSGLFLIGDPKQAIYRFRGADVFAYLKAKKAAVNQRTLLRNWRSDPRLVEAVNLVMRGPDPEGAFLLAGIPFEDAEPQRTEAAFTHPESKDAPLHFLLLPPDPAAKEKAEAAAAKGKGPKPIAKTRLRGLPAYLAREILTWLGESGPRLDGRSLQPQDLAVLCRTKRQASEIQAALRDVGIPSTLRSDESIFESREATELDRLLWALAEPQDSRRVQAALTTALLGQSAASLRRMQEDERLWDDWMSRFRDWSRSWERDGFIIAFRRLLDERGVLPRLVNYADGERRATNVRHLMELLHQASLTGRGTPLALAQWLSEMRKEESRDDLDAEVTQLRLESDESAVSILTMHRSKGLQYPVVFCPYLWDLPDSKQEQDRALFHDPEADHRLSLDMGTDRLPDHQLLAEHESLAESVRLAYVALTRARHACVVVWGDVNGAWNTGYGWLLHRRRGEDWKEMRTRQKVARPVREDLQNLASRSEGRIHVRPFPVYGPAPEVERWRPDGQEATAPLVVRRRRRHLAESPRTSSFSGLIRGLHQPDERPADLDDGEREEGTATGGPTARWLELPSGPRFGNLVHAALEKIDFQGDEDHLGTVVEETLRRFGEPASWTTDLVEGLREVLDTPLTLGSASLRLRDIPRQRRRSEMEFLTTAGRADLRLEAGAVAGIFRQHATFAGVEAYAKAVERLGFAEVSGFLNGIIDLVFEHEGRFYVADYKTNHLGTGLGNYELERLPTTMAHRHYYLQYHFYAAGLHRYLQQRRPGYDHERHFGGVAYLFLRGMGPHHATGTGVFFDRPSARLIEGLGEVFGHPRGKP